MQEDKVKSALDEQFTATCDAIRTELKRERYDREGNVTGTPAAIIMASIAFLKLNNHTALPTKDSSFGKLVEELENLPFEEVEKISQRMMN